MRRTMLPKLATAAACLMLASCGLFSKEKLQLDGNIKFICHDRM